MVDSMAMPCLHLRREREKEREIRPLGKSMTLTSSGFWVFSLLFQETKDPVTEKAHELGPQNKKREDIFRNTDSLFSF